MSLGPRGSDDRCVNISLISDTIIDTDQTNIYFSILDLFDKKVKIRKREQRYDLDIVLKDASYVFWSV